MPEEIEGQGAGAAPEGEGAEEQQDDTLRADLDSAIFGGTDDGDTPTPTPDAEVGAAPDGGVAAADTAPGTPGDDAAPDAGREVPPDDIDGIPAGRWTAEEREKLAAMPPEQRAFLVDRAKSMQADYTKKTEEIAPLRKAADTWGPYLTSLNASPEEAFDNLLRTDYALRHAPPKQREEMFVKLAADYGIEIDTGAGGPAPDPDPLHVELSKHLDPLQEQIRQLQQGVVGQHEKAQASVVDQWVTDIETFRTAKDDAGALQHPHLLEVMDDIKGLVQADRAAGREPTLDSLYERAVWSNPTTRAKMLEGQAAAGVAAQKAAQKVTRARVAASTLGTGGSAPAASTLPERDLREELEASLPTW